MKRSVLMLCLLLALSPALAQEPPVVQNKTPAMREAERAKEAAAREKASGDAARAALDKQQRETTQEAAARRKAEKEAARLKTESDQLRAELEALKQQQAEAAKKKPDYAVGAEFLAVEGQAITPQMVVLPINKPFQMGSDKAEQDAAAAAGVERKFTDRENPRHPVTIRYKLALGKYTVTRGEFGQFVRETGYQTEAEKAGNDCWALNSKGDEWINSAGAYWKSPGFEQTDRHPVVCVSWNDANAYVKWLNGKAGLKEGAADRYRLPSESEWEYAARAGTTTRFYWGEDTGTKDVCAYANGGDQAVKAKYSNWKWVTYPCNDGYAQTAPVGSFKGNAWGLYDMSGNVWQWVEDVVHPNYEGSAPQDGSAWLTGGDQSRRVLRGGSWYGDPGNLRSAYRFINSPSGRYGNVGFRIARTLP